MALKRFIRTLIVTTIAVILAGLLIYAMLPSSYYTPVFPYMVAFFFFATLVVFHFMIRALEKRPAKFVNIFLVTTMLKLFAYMAVMVTYALLNRTEARPFIVAFFVLYIIYTIVEVATLLNENHKIDVD